MLSSSIKELVLIYQARLALLIQCTYQARFVKSEKGKKKAMP